MRALSPVLFLVALSSGVAAQDSRALDRLTDVVMADKRLDRRLLELGATRLSTRLDVDVEGIKRARQWLAAVVGLFVEVHTA